MELSWAISLARMAMYVRLDSRRNARRVPTRHEGRCPMQLGQAFRQSRHPVDGGKSAPGEDTRIPSGSRHTSGFVPVNTETYVPQVSRWLRRNRISTLE